MEFYVVYIGNSFKNVCIDIYCFCFIIIGREVLRSYYDVMKSYRLEIMKFGFLFFKLK